MGGRRLGEQPRERRNITVDPVTWGQATELAAEAGISVSQLFHKLVREEAKRRDRFADDVLDENARAPPVTR